MNQRRMYLCGKCYCDLQGPFKVQFLEGSAEKQACDMCRKKVYGSYYLVKNRKEEK